MNFGKMNNLIKKELNELILPRNCNLEDNDIDNANKINNDIFIQRCNNNRWIIQ